MDCAAADLEAGFSGAAAAPIYRDSRIRGSYSTVIGSPRPVRSVAPPPPPPAGFFYDDFSDEEPQYFLDACFLCKKALSRKDDIFMYRGDTPFCSEECRALQIEMDEAKERKETTTMKQRSSPKKAEKIHVRAAAGTVVTGFSKSNVSCYLPV